MSIQNELNTAIYNKLAAGTALITLLGGTALYFMQAPEDTALPFIVWNSQGGGDENLSGIRLKNLLVQVRGFASSPALAGSIGSQIDSLLHGQSLTVSGGWVNFWLTNEQDISLVETPRDAKPIYSSGAVYRIRLDKSV